MDFISRDHISTLLASIFVPVKKKDNAIRQVGDGECIRHIIGKTNTRLLKENIMYAAGTLQTCAGLESAIHSARSFKDQNSECLLLVDRVARLVIFRPNFRNLALFQVGWPKKI